MERNIPHVLDVFATSPGERRRRKDTDKISSHLKEEHKNAGSDSAVSLDSSDEDERNISKYFDYLDNEEDQQQGGGEISSRKKNIKQQQQLNNKNSKKASEIVKGSSKCEYETNIKHIERHLSMKKTIRKKMMRDLQQAFVENPDEFQQDPARLPKEKKNNIDITNLTISKKKMSKSEHSFLDMLKDNDHSKDSKKQLIHKNKSNRESLSRQNKSGAAPRRLMNSRNNNSVDEEDSGNDSPTREKFRKGKVIPEIPAAKHRCNVNITNNNKVKEEKKISFWKRITGGKTNKNK